MKVNFDIRTVRDLMARMNVGLLEAKDALVACSGNTSLAEKWLNARGTGERMAIAITAHICDRGL